MPKDPTYSWTTFWAAAAAVAAFVTALATWWQARFATRHAILLQLAKDWDSDEMQKIRKAAATALHHPTPDPNNSDPDGVLDHFETVAFLERRQILSLELVWHYFYYWVVPYWYAAALR